MSEGPLMGMSKPCIRGPAQTNRYNNQSKDIGFDKEILCVDYMLTYITMN